MPRRPKEEEFFTVDNKCRFTGEKLGTFQVHKKHFPGRTDVSDEELRNSAGIVDARCDNCTILHGSYKQMEIDARNKGLSQKEFEDIIKKANYKKLDFDKEIKITLEEK